jgi:hypothetical protein
MERKIFSISFKYSYFKPITTLEKDFEKELESTKIVTP